MKFTFVSAHDSGNMLNRLMAKYDEFYWATAWATQTATSSLLKEKYLKKLHRVVIGTDFGHTCPELLQDLSGSQTVRAMPSIPGQTFHPKIYGFVSPMGIAILLGSSNFTNGGLYKNQEACILLEGDRTSPEIQRILTQVEDWWSSASPIDSAFLSDYKRRRSITEQARAELDQRVDRPKAVQGAKHSDLLSWSWNQYQRRFSNPERVKRRLLVLNAARCLFQEYGSLSAMPPKYRRALCGATTDKQRSTLETAMQVDWRWFGNMRGAAMFLKAVVDDAPGISGALDKIPPSGKVAESDYEKFVSAFCTAMGNWKSSTGVNRAATIVSASRLLAMKRPDVFICIDGPNREGIADTLGFDNKKLSFQTYWGDVVRPIVQSQWWSAARPSGKGFTLWDGRVAMLDELF